jgi:2-oxo-4-hydroxy-4-carboxy-5-ureidoimidazoline decarboxylase
MTKIPLAALNAMDVETFSTTLGEIFEHSPWVAEKAHAARPFADIATLHATMVAVVDEAGDAPQLALLRAHPELAQRGPLTDASTAEQTRMGLNQLGADEAATMDALNATYRAQFGFPFIIAVRGQRDRNAIIAALGTRLANTEKQERTTALAEVAKIARFRLDDLIGD